MNSASVFTQKCANQWYALISACITTALRDKKIALFSSGMIGVLGLGVLYRYWLTADKTEMEDNKDNNELAELSEWNETVDSKCESYDALTESSSSSSESTELSDTFIPENSDNERKSYDALTESSSSSSEAQTDELAELSDTFVPDNECKSGFVLTTERGLSSSSSDECHEEDILSYVGMSQCKAGRLIHEQANIVMKRLPLYKEQHQKCQCPQTPMKHATVTCNCFYNIITIGYERPEGEDDEKYWTELNQKLCNHEDDMRLSQNYTIYVNSQHTPLQKEQFKENLISVCNGYEQLYQYRICVAFQENNSCGNAQGAQITNEMLILKLYLDSLLLDSEHNDYERNFKDKDNGNQKKHELMGKTHELVNTIEQVCLDQKVKEVVERISQEKQGTDFFGNFEYIEYQSGENNNIEQYIDDIKHYRLKINWAHAKSASYETHHKATCAYYSLKSCLSQSSNNNSEDGKNILQLKKDVKLLKWYLDDCNIKTMQKILEDNNIMDDQRQRFANEITTLQGKLQKSTETKNDHECRMRLSYSKSKLYVGPNNADQNKPLKLQDKKLILQ